ncbi:Type II/IV secretion system protein [Candidatus Burarchaeum australiense]|nr:Type II/IV secretion system protein [Candidatus Burarchaeum australiense]
MRIRTKVDEVCEFLERQPGMRAPLEKVAASAKLGREQLETIAKEMAPSGVLEVEYPVNMLSGAVLILKQVPKVHGEEEAKGKMMEEYELKAHDLKAKGSILDVDAESRPLYQVEKPDVGPYTRKYLEQISEEMARSVPIAVEEMVDPRKGEILGMRFRQAAENRLQGLPGLEEWELKALSGLLLHTMYGLGDIELLMSDDFLEEIAINNSLVPISVYHRKYGWLKTNLILDSEDEIYNYSAQIGRRSGRNITLLTPLMDAHLSSGDRVNATLFPLSTEGNTITIRRFARDPWTIVDFIKNGTLTSEIAAFIWMCVQYEMNVMIVGGTASGKTSLLNTLCALIPPSNRTITIEDTRELNFPSYMKWNWVGLLTRNPNPEGRGEVDMLDLMVSALRMRPDRIIVGEIRKKREAEVLFEAMHTGHAVYSTIHADTGAQMLRRLQNLPFDMPASELSSLNLLLVQYRDRRKGIRRTYEVTEVVYSSDMLSLNSIYKWKPRTDEFAKVREPLRIIEEMNLHTGMSPEEITKDIADKRTILDWMVKRDLRSIEQVGQIMNVYYKRPKDVLEAAKKNAPLGKRL